MELFTARTTTGLKKQLICNRYGHINTAGSIFCDECGAELLPVFTTPEPESPSMMAPIKVVLRVLALISLLSILAVSAGFTYQFIHNPNSFAHAVSCFRIQAASIIGAAAGCVIAIMVIAIWKQKFSEDTYSARISLPLAIMGALGAMALA